MYNKAFYCLTTPLLIFCILWAAVAQAQDIQTAWLQEIMPAADGFSAKQGDPPVYSAFQTEPDADEARLIGYAFMTQDLPPEESGFSAPIDMLIGMDLAGIITGVKVLDYVESYRYVRGDFIEAADFTRQFSRKSITDEFRVNRDIDGISTATITSWAMARGVRNATRRVASAYLSEMGFVDERNQELSSLQWLQDLSWEELRASGFIREFSVYLEALDENLEFLVAFLGHTDSALGEILLGAGDYSGLRDELNRRELDGYLMLIGLNGNPLRLREERLMIRQGDEIFPGSLLTVVYAGTGRGGKVAGHVERSLAMLVNTDVDISQTFTVAYVPGDVEGDLTGLQGIDYLVPPRVLNRQSGNGSAIDFGTDATADSINISEQTRSRVQSLMVFFFCLLAVVAAALRVRNLKS